MTFDATAALSYTFDQENRLTGANGYTTPAIQMIKRRRVSAVPFILAIQISFNPCKSVVRAFEFQIAQLPNLATPFRSAFSV